MENKSFVDVYVFYYKSYSMIGKSLIDLAIPRTEQNFLSVFYKYEKCSVNYCPLHVSFRS